jgi:exodeoxyribonuclease V gamma subunit
MLATALTGERSSAREQRRLLADGTLPPHALGRAWHATLDADVAVVLREVPLETAATIVPFQLEGGSWRLAGRIDGIRGDARYVVRAGAFRPEHRIRAWVEHVAMCAAHDAGVAGMPTATVLIGRAERKVQRETLAPVAGAPGLLAQLVKACQAGLAAPLPFFPQSGWAWLEATHPRPARPRKGKKDAAAAMPPVPTDPRDGVRRAYHQEATRYAPGGDGADAYIALCFRGIDPIADRWDDFEALARTLLTGWRWSGDVP